MELVWFLQKTTRRRKRPSASTCRRTCRPRRETEQPIEAPETVAPSNCTWGCGAKKAPQVAVGPKQALIVTSFAAISRMKDVQKEARV